MNGETDSPWASKKLIGNWDPWFKPGPCPCSSPCASAVANTPPRDLKRAAAKLLLEPREQQNPHQIR
jgi:hypothetical protein